MVSVKIDMKDFNKSVDELLKYHKKLFTELAVNLSRDILRRLVTKTKIGDAVEFLPEYEQRYKDKGFLPKEGLAKGSWVTELNTVSPEGAVFYDSTESGVAITRTFETEMMNFKLGDTVNLHNSLPYIRQGQDGSKGNADGDVAIAEVFAERTRLINLAIRQSYRQLSKSAIKNVGSA